MRYFILLFLAVSAFVLGFVGLRSSHSSKPPFELFPDMDRQAKYKAQAVSPLYEDGRIDRVPATGTVPFEMNADNYYLNTGTIGDKWGDGIALPVTRELMERGHERYDIYCAVCHGKTGAGNGVVSELGLVGIANLHQDRIRMMPDGEIFNTITHGKGQMNGYPHIAVNDRWAIITYLRALQLSQHANKSDVPEDQAGDPYE